MDQHQINPYGFVPPPSPYTNNLGVTHVGSGVLGGVNIDNELISVKSYRLI